MLSIYPAIFYKEDDGRYSVCFPDFNAATCGNDLNDAMNMAVECLAVQLIGLKRDGEAFPVSSPVDTVDPVTYAEELGAGKPSDYFVNLISVDADEYAKLSTTTRLTSLSPPCRR